MEKITLEILAEIQQEMRMLKSDIKDIKVTLKRIESAQTEDILEMFITPKNSVND
ncbi:hypothetical protein [Cytobacillus sp. FSL R5-0596]|uniref:hypothetical protein n=1 Tax=Cytobacillus sp. FSL R5-0596 TaxID=2954696 RepID=UPI0030FC895E